MKTLTALSVLFVAAGMTVPAAAQDGSPSDSAAREALDGYGKCVAERNGSEARRVLTQDFRSATYRTGLKLLSQAAERDCAERVGRANVMRSANLLFAGAVAENLLETDAEPLNVRLIRASENEAQAFAPTDAVAQCLARSMPDQVAILFGTRPGSPEETTAIAPLTAAVAPCSDAAKVGSRVEVSASAMRAMIATAALRLIEGSGDTDA
ncbi:hypothetical protein [Qipengyuania sp. MTN3-11]|uniref:hypothetical protein n=1 Tax=Qipengyuania sp. MTN3-11 TaxID=3056557 RepID=UPI0036F42592